MASNNFLEIIKNLPPELISNIGVLITIIKTAGIIFIVYIIFLIIINFINIKRGRRIKEIFEIVKNIDKKLNKLLKEKYLKKNKS